MDDEAKLGLLLEAAEDQQKLADSSLQRLRQVLNTLGPDLRSEVRATLTQELQAAQKDIAHTVDQLAAFRRRAKYHSILTGALSSLLAAAVALGIVWFTLPSAQDIARAHAELAQLRADIEDAKKYHVTLRPCAIGDKRMCVRIDPYAGAHGPNEDFAVVYGSKK